MKPTAELNEMGQSIWLDNISRALLASGTLRRYRDELGVTGLTSNPAIFDQAVRRGREYDADIRRRLAAGMPAEEIFFALALDDLRAAADLFQPVFERTNEIDGWVSLEVSPRLAYDADGTVAQAKALFAEAGRRNLFIKIPATPQGITALEETIFAGVPVNATLIFSREQYLAVAEAYRRGIERRLAAGMNPLISSVASVFISRWDQRVAPEATPELRNRLGVAMAKQIYAAYRELLDSPRWQRLFNLGVRPQRLLWASTGTKDPDASDVLYVRSLAAPFTINTMPEGTLLAFADHGHLNKPMAVDGGGYAMTLSRFRLTGFDLKAMALELQTRGVASFMEAWGNLMGCIQSKGEEVKVPS